MHISIAFLFILICGAAQFYTEDDCDSSSSATNCVITLNSIGMELIAVDPGTFWMGGHGDRAYTRNEHGLFQMPQTGDAMPDNVPRHEATISTGFFASRFEVRQSDFESVMGYNPSLKKGEGLPVTNVSLVEAREFCARLSELEGELYRLPSEIEWEYICRAGTATRFFWGNDPGLADRYSHLAKDSQLNMAMNAEDVAYGPRHVGSGEPNDWGFHDLIGNVAEWCDSQYSAYPEGELDAVFEDGVTLWISRGGSWRAPVEGCGSAIRYSRNREFAADTMGFRIVREIR